MKTPLKPIAPPEQKVPKKCPTCRGMPGLYPNNECPVCYVKRTLSTPPVEAVELSSIVDPLCGGNAELAVSITRKLLPWRDQSLQTEITKAVINELENEVLKSLVGLGEPKSIKVIWQRIAQLKGGSNES